MHTFGCMFVFGWMRGRPYVSSVPSLSLCHSRAFTRAVGKSLVMELCLGRLMHRPLCAQVCGCVGVCMELWVRGCVDMRV